MNYKKKMLTWLMAATLVFLLPSCEKPILEEEETTTQSQQAETTSNGKSKDKNKGNVVLRVSDFNLVPITRNNVDLTTYCTRLNFVIYKDGNKVESKSQLKEDGNFGEVTFELDPDTYKLLVLAHSSIAGNPVLSDPENIQFTNKLGYSDTFCYYGDLEVKSEVTTHELTLTRASSMLLFTITDEIPDEVTHMYFYYTGGSGVLNALTGYGGNKDSRQEKFVKVKGYSTPLEIHVYTFLRDEEGYLDMKVSALNADSVPVLTREFTHIQMKRNTVTEYKGSFFAHEQGFSLLGDTDWNDTIRLSY